MQQVVRLGRLERVAILRALRLRVLLEPCVPPLTVEQERLVSYVTIEALNLWSSFARAYYLSSVLGAKTNAGTKVAVHGQVFRAPGDALGYAIKLLRPHAGPGPWKRRDEPTWHDPQTLLKVYQALSASHLSDVQNAFSYPTLVFARLPTVRNFFAHRNEETARKAAQVARTYGLSPRLRPSDVLCTKLPGRPQAIAADWIDDLCSVISLLC